MSQTTTQSSATDKNAAASNRRRAERTGHVEPIQLRSLTDQSISIGVAVDLSETGCLVRLDNELSHLPSLVVLDLTLDQKPTRLHAVVQRTRTDGRRTELGLRFVYLGDRERLALRSQLRAKQEG